MFYLELCLWGGNITPTYQVISSVQRCDLEFMNSVMNSVIYAMGALQPNIIRRVTEHRLIRILDFL